MEVAQLLDGAVAVFLLARSRQLDHRCLHCGPPLTDRFDHGGLNQALDVLARRVLGAESVALVRSLVMRPPLVLANEPMGNLDSESGAQVFRLLRAFNPRYGTAFVIVTHDDRLAVRCDRIVHLVDGRVESDTRRTAAE